jgi:hypothetical protein
VNHDRAAFLTWERLFVQDLQRIGCGPERALFVALLIFEWLN